MNEIIDLIGVMMSLSAMHAVNFGLDNEGEVIFLSIRYIYSLNVENLWLLCDDWWTMLRGGGAYSRIIGILW
jgi:hypothetical protein